MFDLDPSVRLFGKLHAGTGLWFNVTRVWGDRIFGRDKKYMHRAIPGKILNFSAATGLYTVQIPIGGFIHNKFRREWFKYTTAESHRVPFTPDHDLGAPPLGEESIKEIDFQLPPLSDQRFCKPPPAHPPKLYAKRKSTYDVRGPLLMGGSPYENKAVLVRAGGCSLKQKALNVHKGGGTMLVVFPCSADATAACHKDLTRAESFATTSAAIPNPPATNLSIAIVHIPHTDGIRIRRFLGRGTGGAPEYHRVTITMQGVRPLAKVDKIALASLSRAFAPDSTSRPGYAEVVGAGAGAGAAGPVPVPHPTGSLGWALHWSLFNATYTQWAEWLRVRLPVWVVEDKDAEMRARAAYVDYTERFKAYPKTWLDQGILNCSRHFIRIGNLTATSTAAETETFCVAHGGVNMTAIAPPYPRESPPWPYV